MDIHVDWHIGCCITCGHFRTILAPIAVWIIGILIFVIMLAIAGVFLTALLPVIAIGFLIWIIYSAVKTWRRK